ncbi:hypothetical protein BT63DRAFT_75604 [Microthyrium microscopicum]|uniref:Uncharacterized protein n=1 Tax=Microthyrium microscopicum TaxID=703497 RepID=A0A6A6U4B8_9PEZI|nr:hypothetical protein BT63DRAFT_75604 [Microthyrium microscopicum]
MQFWQSSFHPQSTRTTDLINFSDSAPLRLAAAHHLQTTALHLVTSFVLTAALHHPLFFFVTHNLFILHYLFRTCHIHRQLLPHCRLHVLLHPADCRMLLTFHLC